MLVEHLEALKQQYVGRTVEISSARPQLARFAGRKGLVKTINFNGQALVQFEGPDQAWYDVDLDQLTIVTDPDEGTAKSE